MTPQAALFLEKARKLLVEADTMLSVNLNKAAGQTAYLAGFHVAEALIFERLGKVLKTHNGVQTAERIRGQTPVLGLKERGRWRTIP